MQSKQFQRLGKQIRRLRKRGSIWRDVCLTTKPQILKADGTPDTSLAYKIAFKACQPDRDIQKRLGLREVCIKCNRPFRAHVKREQVVKSAGRTWWDSLSRLKQEAILGRLVKIQELL